MSPPEGNGNAPEAAFERLEGAVGELLKRLTESRMRAEAAEAKTEQLAALVQRFTTSDETAEGLAARMEALEAENADLRDRLDRGREGVDRMIARIRFLENQG